VARAPKFTSKARREYQPPFRVGTPAGLRFCSWSFRPPPELTEPLSGPCQIIQIGLVSDPLGHWKFRPSASVPPKRKNYCRFGSFAFTIVRDNSQSFTNVRDNSRYFHSPRGVCWPRSLYRWSGRSCGACLFVSFVTFCSITNLASNLYYPDQDECTATRKKPRSTFHRRKYLK
jgi:hypothetical protein